MSDERTAVATDVDRIADVWVKIAPDMGVARDPETCRESIAIAVRQATRNGMCWVSTHESTVVGFIYCEDASAATKQAYYPDAERYILLTYGGLLPQWRGSGRFKRLLALATSEHAIFGAQVLPEHPCPTPIHKALSAAGFVPDVETGSGAGWWCLKRPY